MKNYVKMITVSAVTFALTAVLGLLPYVFFIPLLFTCVTRDWKMSVLESLFFGVLSFCYSFMSPTPVALAFIKYPWIPIVPRLLAGLGCHGAYVGLKRLFKNSESKVGTVLPVIFACAVGSVLNTALVVPCLLLTGGDMFGSMTRAVFLGQTLISGVIELAVAIAVVPPLAVTVGRALRLPDYVHKAKKHESVVATAENAENSVSCESVKETDEKNTTDVL